MPKREIKHINLIGTSGGSSKSVASKGRRKSMGPMAKARKADAIEGDKYGRAKARRGR